MLKNKEYDIIEEVIDNEVKSDEESEPKGA
jgi:hypothetical protein